MTKTAITIVCAFIALVALMFALNFMGMMGKSFFGTWGEQIRYDIHKESQTYRDGMQRTLADFATQYATANASERSIIKASVKHQFAQTDTSEYPGYLRDFLATEIGIY